jgi:ubiquinone/menaquinone biosynthesis C-methylase UbiE
MKTYLNTTSTLGTLAEFYDEFPIWSAPFGLKLLDKVDYRSGLTVLDIGSGTGFPLIELAQRLGEGSLVVGIDPWEEGIKRIQKKISYFGITHVKILKASAESIPLEDQGVDLIVSNNGINNVVDMDTVYAECSRVLKPGGQFVHTMNLDKTMFEFYGELEKVLSDMDMDREIGLMRQHIYQKRRPLGEIMNLLNMHGFVIKELEHDQFRYKFSSGTAMLNHYFIRLAFMESWIGIMPEDKVEQIFDKVEKRLNDLSRILGGITLSIPYVVISAIKN